MGVEAIQEMEGQMKTIRQRIKEAQDRHKSYVDAHWVDHSYEVNDWVFLRVKPYNTSIKSGKGVKISPRFLGPFKIVEIKGPVAYRLALPDYLRCMHDVFHVSILRHYISDPTHVIDMSSLQVSNEGALMNEPIRTLDDRIQKLQRRTID